MHPDPRSGCDERSSQCSDELLSVPAVLTRHPMRHAHKVRWQTPVTGAPHLSGRSLCRDPPTLRARRPLIIMMRSRVLGPGCLASGGGRLERGPDRDLAVLEVAPQRDGESSRQCDHGYRQLHSRPTSRWVGPRFGIRSIHVGGSTSQC